eukprot:TRINITY_DN6329_c0_g1_i13.p1 TRINITY_DN6329_c0_g1~~TRINITY_DN6329_c0_g1_i13.p1  ORF type:complete len:594 (-),score=180.20 TRINITY_DN6329_c0_g1_i13:654-2435(-)
MCIRDRYIPLQQKFITLIMQVNTRVAAKADIFTTLFEIFRVKYPPSSLPGIEKILHMFQGLRNDLVNPVLYYGDLTKLEAFISKAKDYLAMHLGIFRCVDPSLFRMGLQWTDSVSRKQVVTMNPQNERLSMLYNLAAMSCNLGHKLAESKQQVKDAVKLFWTSAALFENIRTELSVLKLEEIGVDFSAPNLLLNASIAKALAQQCVVEAKKPEFLELHKLILSKICKCASNLFKTAYGNASSPNLPEPLRKSLNPNLANSLSYAAKMYEAFAHFYAARYYGDDTLNKEVYADPFNTIARAVVLLKESTRMFAECEKMTGVMSFAKNVYDREKSFINMKTKYIQDSNDKKYKQIMFPNLPILEPLGIPKEVNIDEILKANFDGKELLRQIAPAEIAQAEAEYKLQVNAFKANAQEADRAFEQEEKKFNDAHNLIQRVFDIGDQRTNYQFPAELQKKLEKVHLKDGLKGLIDMYDSALGEVGNLTLFIEDSSKKLAEEEKKYKDNKELMKELWTQAPSSEVNKELKRRVQEGEDQVTVAEKECEYYNRVLKTESEEKKLLEEISVNINDLINEIPKSVLITAIVPPIVANKYAFA